MSLHENIININNVNSTFLINLQIAIDILNQSIGIHTNNQDYLSILLTPPPPPEPITNPYTMQNNYNIPSTGKKNAYCNKQACTNVITKQQGNVSKKMLQAGMIKYNGKRGISYNNSNTHAINSTILSENHEANKSLLLNLYYSGYIRYFQPLSTKYNLSIMLNNVIASLTDEEYISVFCIKPHIPKVVYFPPIIVSSTYYVTTRNIISAKYFIFKNYSGDSPLVPSYSYIFNLEDPSNLDTQLSFSFDQVGNSYNYLTLNGRPGTPGSFIMVTIPQDITIDTIYAFNILEPDIYKKYNLWGYTYKGFHIQLTTVAPKGLTTCNINKHIVSSIPSLTPSSYEADINKTYTLVCLTASSILSVYEFHGPTITIKDVNKKTSTIFISNNKYGLNKGTYYMYIPRIYAIALLNNGQESNITYMGTSDSVKYTTDAVIGTDADGIYDFYYGTISINVTGSFQPISLYTHSFGYLHAKNIIIYADTCPNPAPPYKIIRM